MISKITPAILHKTARKSGDKPDPNAQEMRLFPHNKTFTNIPDVDAIITSFLSPEERLNIRFVGQKIKKNLDESHPRKAMRVTLLPHFNRYAYILHDFFAITPDGTKIITAGWNEEAKVWSMKTGDLIHNFQQHRFTAAAITPDGNKIVTGFAHSDIIKVWDIETGKLVLNIRHGGVGFIAITPDGNKIITAHYGYTNPNITIFDMKTGKLIRELRGYRTDICSIAIIAITPDGTKFVTASSDRTAKIWDIETGNLIHTLEGHTREIKSIAITPDGTEIVTASADTVKIWDIKTGNLIHTIEVHCNAVGAIAITPDGTKIVTAYRSSKNRIGIFYIKTGNCFGYFGRYSDPILTNLSITSDGKKIVTGHRNKAFVWNVKEWTLGDETKF